MVLFFLFFFFFNFWHENTFWQESRDKGKEPKETGKELQEVEIFHERGIGFCSEKLQESILPILGKEGQDANVIWKRNGWRDAMGDGDSIKIRPSLCFTRETNCKRGPEQRKSRKVQQVFRPSGNDLLQWVGLDCGESGPKKWTLETQGKGSLEHEPEGKWKP